MSFAFRDRIVSSSNNNMSSPEILSPASISSPSNATAPRSNVSSMNSSSASVQQSDKWTCDGIRLMLKTRPEQYTIVENTGRRASDCWSSFGFPAIIDESSGCSKRINGFVSCRKCLSTYSFVSNSTRCLNNHDCDGSRKDTQGSDSSEPRLTQRRLFSFFTAKQTALKQSESLKIKQLQAEWVCQNVRPFSIVEDDGLRRLIQECISIGKRLVDRSSSSHRISVPKVRGMDASMSIRFCEVLMSPLHMYTKLRLNIVFVLVKRLSSLLRAVPSLFVQTCGVIRFDKFLIWASLPHLSTIDSSIFHTIFVALRTKKRTKPPKTS